MKVLYKTDRVQIAIYDDNNFVVNRVYISDAEKTKGQEMLGDNKYFPTLEGAIQKACRFYANDECDSLFTYVKALRDVWKEMKQAVSIEGK